MLPNTYWIRYFLICNKIANIRASCLEHQNFAELLIKEDYVYDFDSKITKYFWEVDDFLSELTKNENYFIFSMIEKETGYTLDDMSIISADDIEKAYNEYCIGSLKI